ncbi:MAG: FliA/WhiG family RNA polymerase sigma factor, partial [Acidobacteriota bacterium]|nr:FliA/WhiG family RNA polymerase sigma factor [Acidobacteriota bacterium]
HDRLPSQVPIEDLYHAGVLGLMEALERYDPEKKVQFKSYAKFRIRGAILDSLRALDWSPRSLRRQAREVEQTHERLRQRLGRSPTELEVAEEMGISIEEYQHLLGDLGGLGLGSLEKETGENGEEGELLRYRPETDEDPYTLCLRSELQQRVAEAIAALETQEQQVLALYYHEELTMREVGDVIGVGESRVSQIHSAALVKLRSRLRRRAEEDAAAGAVETGVAKERAWKRN